MNSIIRILLIVLSVSIYGILASSEAQSSAKTKGASSSISQGFCCVNGKIISSDKKTCISVNGRFSDNKQKIAKLCAQKPSQKPPAKQIEPVQGYCCNKAEVTTTTEDGCRKVKGFFAQSKAAAEKKCAATKGYCCDGGLVSPSSKGECDREKGNFYTDRRSSDKKCQVFKGYCCSNNQVIFVTKQKCEAKRGTFYVNEREATKVCRSGAAEVKAQGAQHKQLLSDPKGMGKKVAAMGVYSPSLLPDLIVIRTGLDDSCNLIVTVKNNGGTISDKDHQEAKVHISSGSGNVLPADKRYLRVIDPKGQLKKPGGFVSYTSDLKVKGKQKTLVWLDTGHQISESNEQNNGDDQELFCKSVADGFSRTKVPLQLAEGTAISLKLKNAKQGSNKIDKPAENTMLSGARLLTPAALASRLPIEVLSPGMNQIIQPGEELTVRYRIVVPTEPGEVSFRLVDGSGATLATTTHTYEPPVIPGLAGAELTEYGGLITEDDGPEEGQPIGIGDLAFTWLLPDDLVPESVCHIMVLKGTLQGRSATMRVREGELLEPESLGRSGLRVTIDGGSRVHHPGETVRAYVDIIGTEDIPGFSTPEAYSEYVAVHGMYLHARSQGMNVMGLWAGPYFTVISTSADRRSITMDIRLPEADAYPVYAETDEFVLSFLHEGLVGRSGVFNVRPEGVEEVGISMLTPVDMALWQMGTEQQVSWRVFGLDDPEALYFSLDLLDGDSVWSHYTTSDVSCDWATGICSKTINVSGSRMAGLASPSAGSSVYRGSFHLTVRLGRSGPVLATARSAHFAITQPQLEILSPASGDVLRLYHPISVRALVSGGARGPFNISIYHPSLSSNTIDSRVVCSTCPSAGSQEISASRTLTGELWAFETSGSFFARGRDGFTIRVTSESEPGLIVESEEFTIGLPDITVLSPDSATTMRNGDNRWLRWEIDIPTSTATSYRKVDIQLRNEATGYTRVIAEGVESNEGSSRVRGRYRWHVGRHGDLEPGRYTIIVNMYYPHTSMGARSSIFTIE